MKESSLSRIKLGILNLKPVSSWGSSSSNYLAKRRPSIENLSRLTTTNLTTTNNPHQYTKTLLNCKLNGRRLNQMWFKTYK